MQRKNEDKIGEAMASGYENSQTSSIAIPLYDCNLDYSQPQQAKTPIPATSKPITTPILTQIPIPLSDSHRLTPPIRAQFVPNLHVITRRPPRRINL